MRLSEMFMPTQREIPSEAEIPSHQLMLRAGLMRKIASGVYSYLPLGYRTFRKIEAIIREEMDRAGAQEIIMPAILPAEIYKGSGRWDVFGPEMFRLKDRSGREFCLGPTHEEPFTETVRNEIRSYKALPVTLYQIQHKYRDEKRPRFGVMRSREFVMKDAYSFDRNETGLDESYRKMADAYRAIFDRCGLDYITVEADSGAMGGSGSQEFMVRSDVGEAAIAYCDKCGYAANEERAECVFYGSVKSDALPVERVYTPDSRTIEELMDFLGAAPTVFAKSLIYMADGEPVMAVVRGDRELNETKLSNLLGCIELVMAGPADVESITGAAVGFAGPCGLKKKIRIICDLEVAGASNLVTGANETSYHLRNINPGRDFIPDITADIRNIVKGDKCPACGAPVDICRGIEVGHIFKLGTKYSEKLGCNFLDDDGSEHPMIMGCYGIGLNRTMAAVIEQKHDDNGIIWPVALAPYHVTVVPVMISDETQMKLAEDIYSRLIKAGVEALIDDRDERPGVKFKDNELTGIPFRITVGRKAGEGIAELKIRSGGEMTELAADKLIETVVSLVRENC